MIDRSKYPHKYAPPAAELIEKWTRDLPSGFELESFFLNELCETSAHDYFLAVSDLFAEVVSNQLIKERCFSLCIMSVRLLDAADHAESADKELAAHFQTSVKRFGQLYYETAQLSNVDGIPARDLDFIRLSCLAVNAILFADLPTARMIFSRHHPLRCGNPKCSNDHEIQCQDCGNDITAYAHSKRFRN